MSSASRSEPELEVKANGLIHASAVAIGRQGVLIIGASGSGKSALALELMALGATLVSDDQVRLQIKEADIMMTPPDAIAGMIEARGVGVLAAEWRPALLRCVIDLDETETERLPMRREIAVMGQNIPLVQKVETGHFPAAIIQYMKGGRTA